MVGIPRLKNERAETHQFGPGMKQTIRPYIRCFNGQVDRNFSCGLGNRGNGQNHH